MASFDQTSCDIPQSEAFVLPLENWEERDRGADVHHQVFAITDGEDPYWATWYADWLVNLSRLAELVGRKPVRSEVTYLLVALDKEHVQTAPFERWKDFYAVWLIERLPTCTN